MTDNGETTTTDPILTRDDLRGVFRDELPGVINGAMKAQQVHTAELIDRKLAVEGKIRSDQIDELERGRRLHSDRLGKIEQQMVAFGTQMGQMQAAITANTSIITKLERLAESIAESVAKQAEQLNNWQSMFERQNVETNEAKATASRANDRIDRVNDTVASIKDSISGIRMAVDGAVGQINTMSLTMNAMQVNQADLVQFVVRQQQAWKWIKSVVTSRGFWASLGIIIPVVTRILGWIQWEDIFKLLEGLT